MPLYDYMCTSCDDTFCEMYKVSDREIPVNNPCRKCGKMTVQKRIGNLVMADTWKLGRTGPPDWFKDRLKEVHRRTPGSILDKTSKYVNAKDK